MLALAVSNNTLYAIVALLVIVCLLFWLFGRR